MTYNWFESTVLGDFCTDQTHCSECTDNGSCDACDTIDGRWMEAVNEYASTCDGCGELTMNAIMHMNPKTQLGYCPQCIEQMHPNEILKLEW